MTIEELEARSRTLEDFEAIQKLKAIYCFPCDAGLEDERNRDALIARFRADARVDFGLGPASVKTRWKYISLLQAIPSRLSALPESANPFR